MVTLKVQKQIVEISDTQAVCRRVQLEGIEQYGEKARLARAYHVVMVEVAYVCGLVRGYAGAFEREPEDGRVRFFHADNKRIDEEVEIAVERRLFPDTIKRVIAGELP